MNHSTGIIFLADITNELVPFTLAQITAAWIHLAVAFLGIISGGVTVTALLLKRDSGNIDQQFILSLCISDLTFILIVFVHGILHVQDGGWYN